ncbi:MAG: Ig-like domain repeat protein, partial [Patulibacter sp.]
GFGLFAGLAGSAQAATTNLHAAPVAAGAADCGSAANACTIETAVTTANAASVADDVRIALAAGNYPLPVGDPAALVITFAGPSLTLEAQSGTATLDGQGATRLLSVGATSNVTVDGLAFERGTVIGLGGAVENFGTLAVRNARFSDNSANNGGAISNAVDATLTVEDSTLSDNVATGVGGGAIIANGTATLTRTLIADNEAPINGGAVNVQPAGTVTINSSTIMGNTSGGQGGAVSNLGTLNVQSSTIAGNSGTAGSAIASGNANVTLAASIVAAQSSSGPACDPADTIVDGGYNLDSDGTCVSETSSAPGSHSGTEAYGSSTYGAVLDAYLADTLADNGGPSRTLALLNSPSPLTTQANPAFDVVPPSFALPVPVDGESAACAVPDQRGVSAVAGADCAIGAYRLQATSIAAATSAESVEQDAPVTYTATVTPAADGGTVAFDDGPGNPATSDCAAQPVSGGTATCTVSYPSVGSYPVTATYSGDGTANRYAPSSASAPRTVVVVPRAVVPPEVVPPAVAPPAVVPPTTGPPVGPAIPQPSPALKLTRLTFAPRCPVTATGARRTGAIGYTVNLPSRVTFVVQRRVKLPNAVGSRCPAKLAPGRSGVPTDYVNVRGRSAAAPRAASKVASGAGVLARTVSVPAGSHKLDLKTLLGTTTLQPGRYRVLVQAVGTDGAKVQKPAYFWVLRAKDRKP